MTDDLMDEILYGRNPDNIRVFISSKMDGSLDDERRRAADAIDRLDTHKAWWWEQDAPVGVLHSEAECIKFARTSDHLILLVAGPLSRIIHSEYEAAKDAQAERYIFIRSGATLPSEVESFITSERETIVTRNFQNAAELETLLYDALKRTVVRAFRQGLVHRRQNRDA